MNDIECTSCVVFATEIEEPQQTAQQERREPLWVLLDTLVQEALA